MNISDPNRHFNEIKASIQSLQDWWALAGVDLDYDSNPLSLLAQQSEKPALQNVAETKPPAPTNLVEEKATKPPVAETPSEDYPNDYEAFQHWLNDASNLHEHSWARDLVLPVGNPEPDIMIVSAMPEASGVADNQYYSANALKLLKNMLLAIGVEWDSSYSASLSFGRTIDGRLTEEQVKPLVNRARHLISLVKPKRIIVFGDTASRAFFGEDLLNARKKKQFINHVSSTTEAIVTFHPRILLERPELKAEAWKDLQMLTRIANQ